MFKNEIGQTIPGLTIHGVPAPYGVVNERSVRATAGIMFSIGFFTLLYTFFTKDYFLLQVVVSTFFFDFFIKVLWGPKYSPLSFLGKTIVSQQKPEYVGAIQKRFAWTLGLLMSGSVLLISIFFEIRGILPLSLCATCLSFMWLESSAGICVGCKIYYFLIDKKIIKTPQIRPACPGGSCSLKNTKKTED
ncbi:MAG: DUF4395 domain-containing protein [Candidatus Gracilibacteria bacterium]|nr:DUF4395 domain-containing protein [Candidatus Gracilibacteria bacterium]